MSSIQEFTARLLRAGDGGAIADRLRSRGAKALPRAMVRVGRDPMVLATVDPAELKDLALLALAFDVTTEADATRLQLRGGGGLILDEITVGPGHVRLVLFSPLGRASLVARSPEGRVAKAKVEKLVLYGFAAAHLKLARLAKGGDPKPPFDWSCAYLDPEPDDIGGRLRLRTFRHLTKPTPAPMGRGLSVLLEPGDEMSRAFFISGAYEPETGAAIRALLPRSGVFVDGGAYCGMFTLLAARLVGVGGRVFAFEPSEREFARLEANIALNRLTNVTASRAALAQAPGTATLRLAEPGHAGHNTIGSAFAYPAVKMVASPQVRTVALDDALAEAGATRCDLIKLDLMGAELMALKGAQKTLARFRPTLLLGLYAPALEAHDAQPDDLRALLQAQGYALRDLDPQSGRILAGWSPEPSASKIVAALPED